MVCAQLVAVAGRYDPFPYGGRGAWG